MFHARHVLLGLAEARNIGPGRNADADAAGLSAGQVEMLEGTAEASGLDADDRVGLRIEVRAPAEHRRRDVVGLDAVAAADSASLTT